MIFHQNIKELLGKLFRILKWLTHIEISANAYYYSKFQGLRTTHGPSLTNETLKDI